MPSGSAHRSWGCVLSFWGSLFGGSNPTLNTNMGEFGSIGGFATGTGEKNISTASNFWNSIVGGDATKQAQVLAPEISAAKKSAQQDTKSTTEMGSRSGGTAATNATAKDKVRSDVTDLLGKLTEGSVSGLASSGSDLLKQGQQAFGTQTELSEQQMEDWSNSILGLGITKGAGFGEGFALGKI